MFDVPNRRRQGQGQGQGHGQGRASVVVAVARTTRVAVVATGVVTFLLLSSWPSFECAHGFSYFPGWAGRGIGGAGAGAGGGGRGGVPPHRRHWPHDSSGEEGGAGGGEGRRPTHAAAAGVAGLLRRHSEERHETDTETERAMEGLSSLSCENATLPSSSRAEASSLARSISSSPFRGGGGGSGVGGDNGGGGSSKDAFSRLTDTFQSACRTLFNRRQQSQAERDEARRMDEAMAKLRSTPVSSVLAPNSTILPTDAVAIAARRSGLLGSTLTTDAVRDCARILTSWYRRNGYVLHSVTGATLHAPDDDNDDDDDDDDNNADQQNDNRNRQRPAPGTAVLSVSEPKVSSTAPVHIIGAKEMIVLSPSDPLNLRPYDEEELVTFRQYKDRLVKRHAGSHKARTVARSLHKDKLNTTFVQVPARTSPTAVAKALDLRPGSHFCWRPERWSNVLSSGLFQKVLSVGPRRNVANNRNNADGNSITSKQDDTVTLEVIVTERPPRSLEYGITKSLYTGGWEGEMEAEHGNVFGGGEKVGLVLRRGPYDPVPSLTIRYRDDKLGCPGGYDVELFSEYIGVEDVGIGGSENKNYHGGGKRMVGSGKLMSWPRSVERNPGSSVSSSSSSSPSSSLLSSTSTTTTEGKKEEEKSFGYRSAALEKGGESNKDNYNNDGIVTDDCKGKGIGNNDNGDPLLDRKGMRIRFKDPLLPLLDGAEAAMQNGRGVGQQSFGGGPYYRSLQPSSSSSLTKFVPSKSDASVGFERTRTKSGRTENVCSVDVGLGPTRRAWGGGARADGMVRFGCGARVKPSCSLSSLSSLSSSSSSSLWSSFCSSLWPSSSSSSSSSFSDNSGDSGGTYSSYGVLPYLTGTASTRQVFPLFVGGGGNGLGSIGDGSIVRPISAQQRGPAAAAAATGDGKNGSLVVPTSVVPPEKGGGIGEGRIVPSGARTMDEDDIVVDDRPVVLALSHTIRLASSGIPRHEANAMAFASSVRGYSRSSSSTTTTSTTTSSSFSGGALRGSLVGTAELRFPLRVPKFIGRFVGGSKGIVQDGALVLFGDWMAALPAAYANDDNVDWNKGVGSLELVRKSSVGIGLRKSIQGIPLKYDFCVTAEGKIGASVGLGKDFDV